MTRATSLVAGAAGLLLAAGAAVAWTARPAAEAATATGSQAAASAATTAAATYAFDSVHSCALFRVQHLGAGMFYGRFNTLQGSFTFDPSAGPTFDAAIPIESVDTNNGNLDNHLKSPDFFNAKEFPTMTFTSTSAKQTGERTWDVTGDFTMLGTTKSVTAKVEWTGTATMRGTTRTGLEAIFSIKRSDFGMDWGVSNGSLGDETRIIVNIEGVRKD